MVAKRTLISLHFSRIKHALLCSLFQNDKPPGSTNSKYVRYASTYFEPCKINQSQINSVLSDSSDHILK